MGLQEEQEAWMPGPSACKAQALTQVCTYSERDGDGGGGWVLCRGIHVRVRTCGSFYRVRSRQHCLSVSEISL